MAAMGGVRSLVQRALRSCGYEVTRSLPGAHLGRYLMALFEHQAIDCVLDVGAHWGEYGEFLRRQGYRGRIVSFEPVT